MQGEVLPKIGESDQPRVELEPMPHHKILILGAGRGTGREIAKMFAKNGYEVIIGTRSEAKFNSLKDEILADGGIEPQSFIADITNEEQVQKAYDNLHLKEGEQIHFFDVAAGGFDKLLFSLGKLFFPLQIRHRKDEVTVNMLEEITRAICDFVRNGQIERTLEEKIVNGKRVKVRVTQDRVLNIAEAVNYRAPLALLDKLIAEGHVKKGSRILTTSSNISNNTDPDNIEEYNDAQLYLPVGWTKEKAVREIRKRADQVGAVHINIVAPPIVGTETADVFLGNESLRKRDKHPIFGLVEIIEGAFAKLSPDELKARGWKLPWPFPTVTQQDVANGIFEVLNRAAESCKVFIDHGGMISYQKPAAWEGHPVLPLL